MCSTFHTIGSFIDDLKLSSTNIHYLDPENDEDDAKFMRGEFTPQYKDGCRLYEHHDTLVKETVVRKHKPVIYKDVLDRWRRKSK